MSPKAFPTDIHKKLATKTAKSNSNIQPRPRRPRNICQMHGTHLIGTQRGHQRVLTLGAATHQDFRHFFYQKPRFTQLPGSWHPPSSLIFHDLPHLCSLNFSTLHTHDGFGDLDRRHLRLEQRPTHLAPEQTRLPAAGCSKADTNICRLCKEVFHCITWGKFTMSSV